jgi:hypothetical protein
MAGARAVPQWAKSRASRGIKYGYRSGLEEKIGAQIKEAGHEVRFETFKVPYIMPASSHNYTPDFVLDNGIVIEGKGIFDASDRAKHLLLRAQYPELDIRFVFTRSKAPINPGSKTTMAMWCTKHGILFSDKLIPPSWLTEPGPQVHPLEVIRKGPFNAPQVLPLG